MFLLEPTMLSLSKKILLRSTFRPTSVQALMPRTDKLEVAILQILSVGDTVSRWSGTVYMASRLRLFTTHDLAKVE